MIHRIDVRTAHKPRMGESSDPLGQAIRHQIIELGFDTPAIHTARIFLIDSEATAQQIRQVAEELVADPIVEEAQVVSAGAADQSHSRIEIHLKPGVMDPVAASTEMAMRDMGIAVREVRTGRAFIFSGKVEQGVLQQIATRLLANGVIETIHFSPYVPTQFPAGHQQAFSLRHVSLRQLDDAALTKLSREGHLFLSLAEMKAIQTYFKEQNREPTDIELETLAQTWSEHCVHKTLKSAVEVVDESGKVVRKYSNLIKETIFKSTQELMAAKPGFCLSVFKDNAGVIAFDETDAVCFKAETHNHPSAIEPYGGSATGIGGVIRDILGTGLAAKPIANTDVFCVATPDFGRKKSADETYALIESKIERSLREELTAGPEEQIVVQLDRNTGQISALRNGAPIPKNILARKSAETVKNHMRQLIQPLPKGVIHPKRVLQQIVAGVRDYGNRMGIPTVNGAVYFDDRYLGNPLVFCGCVGLIPRNKIEKAARSGDAIVLMGGRTGRDGIHGATFSSAELTDTHADEFSHAVQIGNAITEKKLADVILAARDRGMFSAITDLGAGGLSSAVGEMGEKLGARVELDRVPLKYAGLRYDEIWISEAQERMLLSVPSGQVEGLLKLAGEENVEAVVIGEFGTEDSELILNYREAEVGRISMRFLHEGLPMPTRRARITGYQPVDSSKKKHGLVARGTKEQLLELLAHPNIASKHWIIRQYDHEVQGGSVIKPLTGPRQVGPSDAAVVRPKLGSNKGVVISCGMAPQISDPYAMSIAAIDEAIRNAIAVGADPSKLAILDNFCWPSVEDEQTMGTLVAACEACYDAAKAYGIPFISGKDSLHNQFTNQETKEVLKIPNTLLISAIGVIEDVRKCVTMDLKKVGSSLWRIFPPEGGLKELLAVHEAVHELIAAGLVWSAHDVSDGGMLVALAEMAIASGLGVKLVDIGEEMRFEELQGTYLLEIDAAQEKELIRIAAEVLSHRIGMVTADAKLSVDGEEIGVEEMTKAWRGTLDW